MARQLWALMKSLGLTWFHRHFDASFLNCSKLGASQPRLYPSSLTNHRMQVVFGKGMWPQAWQLFSWRQLQEKADRPRAAEPATRGVSPSIVEVSRFGFLGCPAVSETSREMWVTLMLLLRRKWQPTPVILPGESPWTEEPGRLQSMGSQRVRHDWAASLSYFPFISKLEKSGFRRLCPCV